ncbi:hypothetical protein O7543_00790 [Solwaraspora sp. WMMA2080]|uniref:hypothetical protein n=1 Tax=unclassified Solwaraspora TaxID=2627926 RepID=UPI00248C5858|nr:MULTISPECIES: hypothetical protein [unclassified Solwaraspora]WBB95038.1 hypothetical protein O7553_16585 [Solwaraspora sp. WMMA2059]WBC21079.1 hypothetical protein O7543_00790 [Solwaraspora sp. WMMA2080]
MKITYLILATLAGLVGAVFGSWLGWQTAQPTIDTAAARQVAAVAFPGVEAGEPTRNGDRHGFPPAVDSAWTLLVGGDGYVAGTVRVPLPFGPASTSDGRLVGEAVDRLTAAGWDAERFRASGDYDAFTATRDGVAVRLSARDATRFVIDVGRARPWWVWPLAVTGFLVALITTLLALRQLDAHTSGRAWVRVVAVSLLGAAAVLILPALAVGGLATSHAAITGGDPWAPPWLGFTMVGLRPMAWLAGLLTVTAVLVAAVPPTRTPATARTPGRGRRTAEGSDPAAA